MLVWTTIDIEPHSQILNPRKRQKYYYYDEFMADIPSGLK